MSEVILLDDYLKMLQDSPGAREYLRQQKKAMNDAEHKKAVVRSEGRAEVAKNLLLDNMNFHDILRITGLSVEELENLKSNLKK
jgi:hypothetical protein